MLEQINALSSGVHLQSRLKQHTEGLEKAIPPAATVANVKGILERSNLELVKTIVRIDSGRLGIPVYVCQAGADCNVPSPKTMGKGPTPEQSEASALMEMVERYSHANFPRKGNFRWGTIEDIDAPKMPGEQLFWVNGRETRISEEMRRCFASLPFAWVPAHSLSRAEDLLLPYEWFADIQGTNGLSAGNTMEETVLQGLCEVVERHVAAAANIRRRALPTIDLTSVRDPVACNLLRKFSYNNIQLICKDFSLDTGIPTIAGLAFDPATYPNSEVVYCAGTATHPEKALIRVLTEIQQMAVDDFRRDYYAGGILPKLRSVDEAEYLFDDSDPVAISTLPDLSAADLLQEIENCTRALSRIGFEPLVVNISHPLLEIPAVFVIMAGSQLYDLAAHELNVSYYLGRRMAFRGQTEAAMAMFRKAMAESPKAALHCTLEIANCLRQLKRWREAMEAYQGAYGLGADREMQMRIIHFMTVCAGHLKKDA